MSQLQFNPKSFRDHLARIEYDLVTDFVSDPNDLCATVRAKLISAQEGRDFPKLT